MQSIKKPRLFLNTTSFLCIAVLLTGLVGCSNSTKNETTSSSKGLITQPTPACSATEFGGGSAWIKGQLKAFGDSSPNVAYSYASEKFRSETSLENFISVIRNQYSMLLDLKSYDVGQCTKSEGYFLFEVSLVDKADFKYTMRYVLSYVKERWGVEGAAVYSNAN